MNKAVNLYLPLLVSGIALVTASVSVQADSSHPVKHFPKTATQWKATTQKDIEAAYQQSVDNHPGMFDSDNPGFPQLLFNAKQHALMLADQVENAQGYAAAIARFNSVLQDGHAGAVALLPDDVKLPRRWPGFSAVWRGDGLKVYYSEHDKVTKGDKIVRCNNTPIEPLMRDTLFKFYGEVDQPGHWWNQGWRLLVDDGNPFLTPFKSCDFVKVSGATYSVRLEWSERPKNVRQHLVNAYNGDELEVGLHWATQEIAWIAMPSFSPNEEQKARYRQLFTDLAEQREQLLTAKAVILDLRHNQGGSTYWSMKIAEQLWGPQHVTSRREQLAKNTRVWWRASKDNTQYLESLKTKVQDQPEVFAIVKQVSAGMQTALDMGEPFYIEKKPATTPVLDEISESDFNTKAIVIVPGQCASACLDAIDTFKLFSNTVLFGAPSSADSTYMDVRFVDTPSGLSKVIIPNKVYVNRARGKGDFYWPDIPYHGVDWTTEVLLEHIERVIKKSDL